MPHPIDDTQLARLLAIDDLTLLPEHAVARMAQHVAMALPAQVPISWIRGPRIVKADHNYRLLGYPGQAVVQESTYTHWVDDTRILRTQTTSMVLGALLDLAKSPQPVALLAPGIVYRRDVRDRWHCGQPHQMDVWVLVPAGTTQVEALRQAVKHMVQATVSCQETDIQVVETEHPYTQHGMEISVRWEERWLEVGEAGMISPDLLSRVGIDSTRWTGWAMGWGLDRLVMARKQLPDIRLLRDPLAAVSRQMAHLDRWVAISRQPVAKREISVALPGGLSDEVITEQVLVALAGQETLIQDISITGRWAASGLAAIARERLGMDDHQENVLLQITWQSEDDSLARERVNAWMRKLYRHLHAGTAWTYCP